MKEMTEQQQLEQSDLITEILNLIYNRRKRPFDVLYECISKTSEQLIDTGLEQFSKDQVLSHIGIYNNNLIDHINSITKYQVPVVHRCIIKGCDKEGNTRLIHSDTAHKETTYGMYHGWVCGEHVDEIYQNNFPYLYGDGWNMSIGEGMNMMPCKACDIGGPCGRCGYRISSDNDNDITKWDYMR